MLTRYRVAFWLRAFGPGAVVVAVEISCGGSASRSMGRAWSSLGMPQPTTTTPAMTTDTTTSRARLRLMA